MRRVFRVLAACCAVAVLIVALPVIGIETSCRSTDLAREPAAPSAVIVDEAHRLPLTNSVLSYPEWYIVYAYRDFAAVLQHSDEGAFPYLGSIADYWTGFCAVNRVAVAQGGGALDEKVMLYVIGLSFTVEMGLKGAYETTIGHLFAWLRGPEKTNEDRFVASVAQDYAQFLDQRPWYEFPFGEQVRRLAHDIPFGRPASRAIERRFALTSEWTIKSGYASLLSGGAALDPAALHIESVMRGLDPTMLGLGSEITLVRDLGGGLALVSTPRYAAFTRILVAVARQGGQVMEIAGNDVIFLTVLTPPDVALAGGRDAQTIFIDPVRSRPGWHRNGMLVQVPALAQTIRAIDDRGAVLEHIYDY